MHAFTASDDLLRNLFYELFQTERSAERHSIREADRLGDCPPAVALRAVSEHARSMKATLDELARKNGLAPTASGKALGDLFSELRERAVDHALSLERSYRMTLIGMRHGVDVVYAVKAVAEGCGKLAIEAWCVDWLAAREPLVAAVAARIEWFARNPKIALEPARSPSVALGIRRSHGSEHN